MMDPPFNMLIVGPTCCGKTYYLLKMLEDYEGVFDRIVLICPTVMWNETYLQWRHYNDLNFVILPVSQDAVDQTLKETVYAYMGTNTLIVIDDCASGQDVKNRTSELVKLGFSARHYKLSTIVLTQQLTSVAKPYRENLSRIVTFHNVNKTDMKVLSESYLSNVSKDALARILQDLKDNKHACLEIDLRHPWDYRVKT